VAAASDSGVTVELIESAGVDVAAASDSGVTVALIESAGVDVAAASDSGVQGKILAECNRIVLDSTVRTADCH